MNLGLSLDNAQRLLNEQEESIAELEHKILDREDQRDVQIGKVMELKKALRRIECAEDIATATRIAGEALVKLGI